MSHQALPGFRDFDPDDLAFRAHLVAAWRAAARRFGFEEYDGPPLEPLELYTAKSGDEIVGQLYAFEDKGGRQVALRPEMTPTLARLVAARANGLKKPIRWFAVPQLFRYERQQRGRLREHFQFNADLIGEPGPLADAEVIALAVDAVRGLGLGPAEVRVRLSDREALQEGLRAVGVAEAQFTTVFGVVDKLARTPRDRAAATLRDAGLAAPVVAGVFRLLECRRLDDLRPVLRDAPTGEAAAGRMEAILAALGDLGVADWVDLDLTIVRGLAYYTSTVFELFDARGEFRAVCGGGRYDGLLSALGGLDLPAVGFGMGDVVLGELLKARGRAPTRTPAVDVFVAAVTTDDMPHARRLAAQLRAAGHAVEYALTGQPIGRQLKLADTRHARWAVVIGPDDRERGEVQLKDLHRKAQHAVPLEQVAAALAASGT